jgi:hypothetical protein
MEPFKSSDMPDELHKNKRSDEDSMVSHATTRSVPQRRRDKTSSPHSRSVDEARRTPYKIARKTSLSTIDLNNKSLPPIPPHVNNNSADSVQKARAAAIAAALSPPIRKAAQETTSISRGFSLNSGSLERYAIPEDDVLSLKSGRSVSRSLRREKVLAKRQKDFEEERSRKLDEAIRLLHKDVQKKREALDLGELLTARPAGSQTPRQLPSIQLLRTSSRSSQPSFPYQQFSLSPVSIFVDYTPSGLRRIPQASETPDAEINSPQQQPDSQEIIDTNGSISPISSAPSSPTESQYSQLAKQPIRKLVSPPPSCPPPNPSSGASSRVSTTKSFIPAYEDQEMRIAALEEQKWVLEQALRVLLNQQSGKSTPGSVPILGHMDRTPSKPT